MDPSGFTDPFYVYNPSFYLKFYYFLNHQIGFCLQKVKIRISNLIKPLEMIIPILNYMMTAFNDN